MKKHILSYFFSKLYLYLDSVKTRQKSKIIEKIMYKRLNIFMIIIEEKKRKFQQQKFYEERKYKKSYSYYHIV